jgi:threonine dehydrogenase-like Zn-dependent dehydrogenase
VGGTRTTTLRSFVWCDRTLAGQGISRRTARRPRSALAATEDGGHCTHAAVLFDNAVPLPMLAMYSTGVHLHIGRVAARPPIPAILALTAAGRVDPGRVTDRVVPWEDAPVALREPHTKLVFAR